MGNDFCRDFPESIGAGRDEEAVHGPVVVLAEREAVGGVVVGLLAVGDEMRGIDKGQVTDFGHADAESAGGALAVVDFEDLFPEGGTAAGAGLVVIVFVLRRSRNGRSLMKERFEGGPMNRKIPTHKVLAQDKSVGGREDKAVEAVGEAGINFAHLGHKWRHWDRLTRARINGPPVFVLLKMVIWEIRSVLIQRRADNVEVAGESFPERLRPWDTIGRGLAGGDEIEHGEEQDGFVWFLVAGWAFADDADMESVDPFNGLVDGLHVWYLARGCGRSQGEREGEGETQDFKTQDPRGEKRERARSGGGGHERFIGIGGLESAAPRVGIDD